MTLSEILYNRSKLTDETFIGEIIIRDNHGFIQQSEPFESRIERKDMQTKLALLYDDKLKNRQWTISILLT